MGLKLPWKTQTLDDGRIQSQSDCGGYVAWVESYEKLEGAVWWAAVVYKANRMHAEEPRGAWSNHSAEPRSLAAAQEAAEAAAARLLAEDAGVRALMGLRWIPVTERLPDEAEDVVTLDAGGRYAIDYLRHGQWMHLGFPRGGDFAVTHWRPLPPGPEVGQ